MGELDRAREFKVSDKKLFDVLPQEAMKKLESKEFENIKPYLKRLFEFDPTEIYQRLNELGILNPFKRHSSVPIGILFPDIDNLCACGCGEKLIGRRKRWATDDCKNFAQRVFFIINGYTQTLRYLRAVYIGGYFCEICGEREHMIAHELDHIWPVKFGGGGGWLSNYQFKCRKCHREKTNKDFGYKTK